MRIVYLLLLASLLIAYWKVLSKVLKDSTGLTPILGWMVGLAYFLLGPLVILTLNGGFELPAAYEVGQRWGRVDLTTTRFFLPYLVIWISVMSSCLAVYIFLPSLKQRNSDTYSLSRGRLERVLLITMAITATVWGLTIWLVGGISEFLVSHWYLRSEGFVSSYGDSYVLMSHLSFANTIIFTSTAALYTARGLKYRDTRWWFIFLIILFFLCGTVMTGNRIFLAIYLLAFLTSCWVLQRRKLIVVMLAISPILVLVFSTWSSLRHDLSKIPDSVTTYAESDFGNRAVTSLVNVTEGTSVMLLLHMINDFGNQYNFLYGRTYSRTFTSLIPRSIYPEKPDNFTLFVAKVYLPNAVTSLGTTALGEMYANFGALTLVFFPGLTLGVVALNRWVGLREREHPLLPPLMFVVMVWMSRVTFADSFVALVLALVLISLFRFEKGLRAASANVGPVVFAGGVSGA